jgi:ceramide glucosyltransferase
VAEPTLRALFFHELRWARTIRAVRPASYAASLLTHGIPISLLWLAVSSHVTLASTAVVGQLAIRCLGRVVVYRAVGQPVSWADTLLVPVRDVASFVIALLSFAGRHVRWNENRFDVGADGYLRPATGAVELAARLERRRRSA